MLKLRIGFCSVQKQEKITNNTHKIVNGYGCGYNKSNKHTKTLMVKYYATEEDRAFARAHQLNAIVTYIYSLNKNNVEVFLHTTNETIASYFKAIFMK